MHPNFLIGIFRYDFLPSATPAFHVLHAVNKLKKNGFLIIFTAFCNVALVVPLPVLDAGDESIFYKYDFSIVT